MPFFLQNYLPVTNYDKGKIIDNEIQYILDNKTKLYDCGWIYNEGLQGNCPDLDTFSEIIRINISIKENEELSSEVDKVLQKVFDINSGYESFKTWIIYENEKDYLMITDMLNMSSEVDVNSNFVCALYNLNYEKYKDIIHSCLEWLYKQQNQEGTWESSWYVGNYYSGYVLSKTFQILNKDDVVNKYFNFLIETQNQNGSWGSGIGNPLDTAYAVLALININKLDDKITNVARKGLEYLLQTVNDNGYWYGCEFIKMGKGKHNPSDQMLRYRSAVLTTMFCVYALSKAKFIFENAICEDENERT